MTWPLLTALAIGPGLLLLHVIYAVDRHREPVWNVLRYAAIGALVPIPAILVELMIVIGHYKLVGAAPHASLITLFLFVFLGVALVEEWLKRVALRFAARRDRRLDEPFDWIVYSVAVSIGFSTIENIGYVLKGGLAVGLL